MSRQHNDDDDGDDDKSQRAQLAALEKDILAGMFGEKNEVTRGEKKRNGEKKGRNKGEARK